MVSNTASTTLVSPLSNISERPRQPLLGADAYAAANFLLCVLDDLLLLLHCVRTPRSTPSSPPPAVSALKTCPIRSQVFSGNVLILKRKRSRVPYEWHSSQRLLTINFDVLEILLFRKYLTDGRPGGSTALLCGRRRNDNSLVDYGYRAPTRYAFLHLFLIKQRTEGSKGDDKYQDETSGRRA